ncbi:hypothetical protein FMUBM48_42690 [Nocardia cyriacigeorgica]|nr:hypothetical protein FMUBM48_42690 [Nocardia cyriacigeorgica]
MASHPSAHISGNGWACAGAAVASPAAMVTASPADQLRALPNVMPDNLTAVFGGRLAMNGS